MASTDGSIKRLQFVVAANGTSSWIFDHAYVDGLIAHGMNEWVQEAIYSYQPETIEQGVITQEIPVRLFEEIHVATSPSSRLTSWSCARHISISASRAIMCSTG